MERSNNPVKHEVLITCKQYLRSILDISVNSRKKKTARKKVNTRLKKMSSSQNKEKHGRKTNLANSLRAGYASYFKAVFLCELWQFVTSKWC